MLVDDSSLQVQFSSFERGAIFVLIVLNRDFPTMCNESKGRYTTHRWDLLKVSYNTACFYSYIRAVLLIIRRPRIGVGHASTAFLCLIRDEEHGGTHIHLNFMIRPDS